MSQNEHTAARTSYAGILCEATYMGAVSTMVSIVQKNLVASGVYSDVGTAKFDFLQLLEVCDSPCPLRMRNNDLSRRSKFAILKLYQSEGKISLSM